MYVLWHLTSRIPSCHSICPWFLVIRGALLALGQCCYVLQYITKVVHGACYYCTSFCSATMLHASMLTHAPPHIFFYRRSLHTWMLGSHSFPSQPLSSLLLLFSVRDVEAVLLHSPSWNVNRRWDLPWVLEYRMSNFQFSCVKETVEPRVLSSMPFLNHTLLIHVSFTFENIWLCLFSLRYPSWYFYPLFTHLPISFSIKDNFFQRHLPTSDCHMKK